MTWKSDIVPNEVRNHSKVDSSFIYLFLIEANTAHCLTLEKGRLFGIEDRNNEITLQSPLFCDCKSDRKTNSN